MKNWDDALPPVTMLDETHISGRPAFVAYFFTSPSLAPHAQGVLDAWLELVPPKTALYYSHDRTKRFPKLTPKALSSVRDSFAEKKLGGDEYARYIFKSAPEEGFIDGPHAYSLELYATVPFPGFAYVTLPIDYVAMQGADAVLGWFRDWCTRFEVTHARAGYGFEVTWFGDRQTGLGAEVLARCLRYHGVAVWERASANMARPNDRTLDTAAWLTYLGQGCLDQIGPERIAAIDPGVTRHPTGQGVVFQAGAMPDACDTNRRGPAYKLLKSVNDAIVPIRSDHWYQNYWASDDPDKENRWFSRMDG
jgi:hypothetical protein